MPRQKKIAKMIEVLYQQFKQEQQEAQYQIFYSDQSVPQIQKIQQKQEQLATKKRPRRNKQKEESLMIDNDQQQKQLQQKQKRRQRQQPHEEKQYRLRDSRRQKIKKQIEANERDLQYKYKLQAQIQFKNQNPPITNYQYKPQELINTIMKYQIKKNQKIAIHEDINKFNNVTVSEQPIVQKQYAEPIPSTLQELLITAKYNPKFNSQIVGMNQQQLEKYKLEQSKYSQLSINNIRQNILHRIVFQYRRPYLISDRKYNVLMKNGKSIVMTERCLKTYFPHLIAQFYSSKTRILRQYLENLGQWLNF